MNCKLWQCYKVKPRKSGFIQKWQLIYSKTNSSLHPTGKRIENLRFKFLSVFWTDYVLIFFHLPPLIRGQNNRLRWGYNDEVTVQIRCQQAFLKPMLYEAWKFYSGKEWAAEPGFHSTAMETAPSDCLWALWNWSISPFFAPTPTSISHAPSPSKMIKGYVEKVGPQPGFCLLTLVYINVLERRGKKSDVFFSYWGWERGGR